MKYILKRFHTLHVVAIALILVIIGVAGVFARQSSTKHTDEAKVHDLYVLRSAIQAYYKQHHKESASTTQFGLPRSLEGVQPKKLRGNITDYNYSVRGDFDYELCATFEKAGSKNNDLVVSNNFEDHKKGNNCFKVDAYQYNISESKYGDNSPYKE